MRTIYLDNSTTTKPSERAISKMLPFLTDHWGVPSAPHRKGEELYPEIEESLKKVYAFLGASEKDQFIFTSSGPEAVNHVFLSTYLEVTRSTGKNQYITSAIDDAPTMMSISRLESMGCVGKMVGVSLAGTVTEELLLDVLSPKTALVSLSYANGFTGAINPIAHLAQICQDRGILVHVDATHALGKLFYELEDIGADFLTFNGDHLHAPKGSGGLWIKEGVPCHPFIVGGLEQAGKRAGSLDVATLSALGVACEEMHEARDFLCTEGARLRDKLESLIVNGYPDAQILFKDQIRLPHVSALAFPGIVNEALLYALNSQGVYASIGGGSSQQLSLVLQASGIDSQVAETAISFSLSRDIHEEAIERAATIIVETAKKLAKTSTYLIQDESKRVDNAFSVGEL